MGRTIECIRKVEARLAAKLKVGDAVRVKCPTCSGIHGKAGIVREGGCPRWLYRVDVLPGITSSLQEGELIPYLPLPGEKVVVELKDGQKVRGVCTEYQTIAQVVCLTVEIAGAYLSIPSKMVARILPDVEGKA